MPTGLRGLGNCKAGFRFAFFGVKLLLFEKAVLLFILLLGGERGERPGGRPATREEAS